METLQLPNFSGDDREVDLDVFGEPERFDVDKLIRGILAEAIAGDVSADAERGLSADADLLESGVELDPEQYIEIENYLPKDTLDLFLHNAKKVPRLTPADEVALAKRIEKGDTQARNRMVEANILLVPHVAKKYRWLWGNPSRGMQKADIVQEGCMGLIRAAEKFDHTKGFRFSTYAVPWIRQAINRSIQDKSHEIRIPVNVQEYESKANKAEQALRNELGRTPTTEEIAKKAKLKPHHIETFRQVPDVAVSLNSPARLGHEPDDKDADELGDLIASVEDVFEQVSANMTPVSETNDMPPISEALLDGLDEIERHVVQRLFADDASAVDIAKDLGVNANRIGTIKARAMRQVRKNLDTHNFWLNV